MRRREFRKLLHEIGGCNDFIDQASVIFDNARESIPLRELLKHVCDAWHHSGHRIEGLMETINLEVSDRHSTMQLITRFPSNN